LLAQEAVYVSLSVYVLPQFTLKTNCIDLLNIIYFGQLDLFFES
jgi:hypothetical protein